MKFYARQQCSLIWSWLSGAVFLAVWFFCLTAIEMNAYQVCMCLRDERSLAFGGFQISGFLPNALGTFINYIATNHSLLWEQNTIPVEEPCLFIPWSSTFMSKYGWCTLFKIKVAHGGKSWTIPHSFILHQKLFPQPIHYGNPDYSFHFYSTFLLHGESGTHCSPLLHFILIPWGRLCWECATGPSSPSKPLWGLKPQSLPHPSPAVQALQWLLWIA